MNDKETLGKKLVDSSVISDFMHGVCYDFSQRFGKAAFDIRSVDASEVAYGVLEIAAIEALNSCKASIDEMKKDGSLKLYIEDLIAKKEENQ